MTMAHPFSAAPLAMAPADDLMEFSTDTNKASEHDEIDIDIDIDGDMHFDQEDENMGEDEDGTMHKDDDEMIDDASAIEDAIIEDVIEYEENQDEITFDLDEELVDAEEFSQDVVPDDGPSRNLAKPGAFTPPVFQTGPQVVQHDETTSTDFAGTGDQAHDNEKGYRLTAAEDGRQDPEELVEENPPESRELAQEDSQQIVQEGTNPEEHIVTTEGATPAEDVDDVVASGSHDTSTAEHEVIEEAVLVHDDSVAGEARVAKDVDTLDETAARGQLDEVPLVEGAIAEEAAHSQEALAGGESGDIDHVEAVPTHDFVYQATVRYQDSEMSLFQPTDGKEESRTFLLNDDSLAHEPIKALLGACRDILGESIEAHEELTLEFPLLGLSYSEDNACASLVQLSSLIDIYTNLQQNDGNDEDGSLLLVLGTQATKTSKLQSLYDAVHEGKGLSHLQTSSQVASTGALSLGVLEEPAGAQHDLGEVSDTAKSAEATETLETKHAGLEDAVSSTFQNEPSVVETEEAGGIDFTSPTKSTRTAKLPITGDVATSLTPKGTTDTEDILAGNTSGLEDATHDAVPVSVSVKALGEKDADVENVEPREVLAAAEEAEAEEEDENENVPEMTLQTNNTSTGKVEQTSGSPSPNSTTEITGPSETAPTDIPFPEDSLDDLDDLNELDNLDPEVPPSLNHASPEATATDATSTNTLQDDQADHIPEADEFDDEITFGDEEDDLTYAAEVVPPSQAVDSARDSSPGARSLKRQRPDDTGDEDSSHASSHHAQPDLKRARSDSES